MKISKPKTQCHLNTPRNLSSGLTQPSPTIIFLIFTLWAFVLTYPLGLHLFSHIPLGDEPVGTVPLFNLWTLQWNIDQLMQGYPNYWDAPIFAPNQGTFAFSETQPLSALLATPLWLGFTSPAVGYNAVVILFLTLNGWFTYWLLKSWGGLPRVALLTGLLMQSSPFIAQEMGVLQLTAIFGFLWSFLFISRFIKQSNQGYVTRQTIICLALGTPVTFFICGYYGLISLLFLPLVFLAQIRQKLFNLKTMERLLVICLLVIALSAPFLLAQRQNLERYNFTRSAQTVENNSAKLNYYLNSLDHNLVYGQILGLESGQGQRLFPGLILVFLAVLGLFGTSLFKTKNALVKLRASQQTNYNLTSLKLYLLGSIVLALLLSLGLRFSFGDFQPYQWIRDHIPGFHQLRSPFRFAVLVQVHLVLLAGLGLLNLMHWFPTHKKLLSISIIVLALLEAIALPLPLQALPTLQTNTSWQTWLNQQEQSSQIVMIPFAESNKVAHFEQTTRWMLESRYFQGNMLNGYSGFFPKDHAHLRELMLQFPTGDGLKLLRDMQTDYVIVHFNLANAPAPTTMESFLMLVHADTQAGVSIYALKLPE